MAQRYTVTMDSGRRERKKLETREALLEAATELFQTKGYDATTIEEIAERVDVSARTFFRYFASKDEVYMASEAKFAPGVTQRKLIAMVSELRARPASEPVLTALRKATRAALETGESTPYDLDGERFRQIVLSLSPQARYRENTPRHMAVIAEVIACRMGVSGTYDLRPYVAAAMAVCAMQSVIELMEQGQIPHLALTDSVDEAFDIIESGVNFSSVIPSAQPTESLDARPATSRNSWNQPGRGEDFR